MPGPIQVLLLDLDDAIAVEDITGSLPAGRAQLPVLTLSSFGAERVARPGTERGQVHWDGIGQAIVRLAAAARSSRPAGAQPEYWIAGRAPLPVFAHLAAELSAWAGSPVLVNRRKDGTWDVIPTTGPVVDGTAFFDIRSNLTAGPSETTGRIAVFVSTVGVAPQRDAIRGYVLGRGEDLGNVVELRTDGAKLLTAENAGTASRELAEFMSQVPGAFPHASGVALLIAGPAHLAFLAGRAVNANMVREVVVPNFRTGEYEDAVRLPWRRPAARPLSTTPEDEAARRETLNHLCDGMTVAVQGITDADVPVFVQRDEAADFLQNLRRVGLFREPQGDAFDLNILQRRLSIGGGLLEALRNLAPDELRRIGAALLFHEVWHFDQNIRSTNYRDVGRAGIALEEIDYLADAVAIGTLARMAVRAGGRASDELARLIEAHVRCVQAFDRSEQGDRLEALAERRLRRYLMWHLQLCRARTVTGVDDIDRLLGDRPIVEIAPLRGHLDARYDKLVVGGAPTSELFVVLRGRLLRHQARPGFSPADLVDAVRTYDWTMPQAAMDFVIGEHASLLVPWVVAARRP